MQLCFEHLSTFSNSVNQTLHDTRHSLKQGHKHFQLVKNKVTRPVRAVRLEHDMLKNTVFLVVYKWQLAAGATIFFSSRLQEH